MSRSTLRTPITGNCGASSDKAWKRSASRAFRRGSRVRLLSALLVTEPDPFLDRRAVANVYCSPKDGKVYRPDLTSPADLSK